MCVDVHAEFIDMCVLVQVRHKVQRKRPLRLVFFARGKIFPMATDGVTSVIIGLYERPLEGAKKIRPGKDFVLAIRLNGDRILVTLRGLRMEHVRQPQGDGSLSSGRATDQGCWRRTCGL